jgi:hypothetical protein
LLFEEVGHGAVAAVNRQSHAEQKQNFNNDSSQGCFPLRYSFKDRPQ